MQAVILAAGRGKRMKGLTQAVAKPMLKIKGKPILEHKINALPKKIKEVVFIIGYHGEHIIKHFKRFFNGKRITYVFQHHINGTGGALHMAKSILDDKFLVMMGDDLYHKKDIANLLKHDLAILGYEVDNPSLFGVIKTNRRGYMVDVIENPKTNEYKLANAGVYVLNKKFFEYELIPKKKGDSEFGLPQTMAQMAKDHKIKVEKARAWHPIGNPDDLKEAGNVLHMFL
jgi:UDP-N-acetylglucosamine diphosphorylase / glucose-1-phosphate thymidylyltransferase / UDP-N-acetylgalactosamine diphosphorylase / glucosamine-1-phosphate N-acetyltransferase / galactosamine-1-phosphate N-acetyltransferase